MGSSDGQLRYEPHRGFTSQRYFPRVSIPNAYDNVRVLHYPTGRDPYPVPIQDYPQTNSEYMLCTGKLTLFHEYSPYVNNYDIYHVTERPLSVLPVHGTTSVVQQPLSNLSRTCSNSSAACLSNDDVEEVTCDVIRKHWCYYVMCLGLCCD